MQTTTTQVTYQQPVMVAAPAPQATVVVVGAGYVFVPFNALSRYR